MPNCAIALALNVRACLRASVYVRVHECVYVCGHQCESPLGYTYISHTDMNSFDPDIDGDSVFIVTVARTVLSTKS